MIDPSPRAKTCDSFRLGPEMIAENDEERQNMMAAQQIYDPEKITIKILLRYITSIAGIGQDQAVHEQYRRMRTNRRSFETNQKQQQTKNKTKQKTLSLSSSKRQA